MQRSGDVPCHAPYRIGPPYCHIIRAARSSLLADADTHRTVTTWDRDGCVYETTKSRGLAFVARVSLRFATAQEGQSQIRLQTPPCRYLPQSTDRSTICSVHMREIYVCTNRITGKEDINKSREIVQICGDGRGQPDGRTDGRTNGRTPDADAGRTPGTTRTPIGKSKWWS